MVYLIVVMMTLFLVYAKNNFDIDRFMFYFSLYWIFIIFIFLFCKKNNIRM